MVKYLLCPGTCDLKRWYKVVSFRGKISLPERRAQHTFPPFAYTPIVYHTVNQPPSRLSKVPRLKPSPKSESRLSVKCRQSTEGKGEQKERSCSRFGTETRGNRKKSSILSRKMSSKFQISLLSCRICPYTGMYVCSVECRLGAIRVRYHVPT